MSKNVLSYLYRFACYFILATSASLFSFLAIQSIFGGAFIPMSASEEVFFTSNTPLVYICTIVFFLLLIIIGKLLNKLTSKQLFLICTLFYLGIGMYLILQQDGKIRADAWSVFESAKAFNKGDYRSITSPGSYLVYYPHQLGLMTLERIYLAVHTSTRFAFAMNLLWTLGSNWFIYRITNLLFNKELVNKYTIFLTFLFFPHLLFILFVYGSVPGLFFCLFSLLNFIKYQKFNKKRNLFLGILAISLACLIRNNYMIFAIMLICCYALSVLRNFSWKNTFAILFIALGIMVSGRAIKYYYTQLIGQPIGGGVPMISFITMGLRDSPDHATLGGWYDGYNASNFAKFNFDEEKASQQARLDLMERINTFVQKPQYAQKFFYEKVRSTWTEPTFQSIWTGPLTDTQQYTHTNTLQSIYEGRYGYQLVNKLGMIILITTYLLSSLYLIYKLFWAKLPLDPFELYPYIFFIGGFLFHFFWETKSQYVYMYALLLMPTVAQALALIRETLSHHFQRKPLHRNNNNNPAAST